MWANLAAYPATGVISRQAVVVIAVAMTLFQGAYADVTGINPGNNGEFMQDRTWEQETKKIIKDLDPDLLIIAIPIHTYAESVSVGSCIKCNVLHVSLWRREPKTIDTQRHPPHGSTSSDWLRMRCTGKLPVHQAG